MHRRLLIIEDEGDIREVAQLSLELSAGWTVFTAPDGATGIGIAEAERPDAILLDVMMPDMDGPTTFRRLQQNPATAGIPVVLLTAKVQASDRSRYDSLGVRGVLSKPFDPMTLAGEIAALLGWS